MSERMKKILADRKAAFRNAIREIEEVKYQDIKYNQAFHGYEMGAWAAIRPVAKEYNSKTFLGIFLGELPFQSVLSVDKKVLNVHAAGNPAIYVPDLKKIIFGYESWWHVIKTPEDLATITDKDIENVWYVKALKELGKEGEGG